MLIKNEEAYEELQRYAVYAKEDRSKSQANKSAGWMPWH